MDEAPGPDDRDNDEAAYGGQVSTTHDSTAPNAHVAGLHALHTLQHYTHYSTAHTAHPAALHPLQHYTHCNTTHTAHTAALHALHTLQHCTLQHYTHCNTAHTAALHTLQHCTHYTHCSTTHTAALHTLQHYTHCSTACTCASAGHRARRRGQRTPSCLDDAARLIAPPSAASCRGGCRECGATFATAQRTTGSFPDFESKVIRGRHGARGRV